MPRRNRILLEQRERIVRAFEDTNEDYLMVADTIGVNRSTARSIVARYIREGRIAERKTFFSRTSKAPWIEFFLLSFI